MGNRRFDPRTGQQLIDGEQPDAEDAKRFGYSSVTRGLNGQIASAVDPSGRTVPFVNGQAPERAALTQQQAGSAGTAQLLPGSGRSMLPSGSATSLTGGVLGPSSARLALNTAPSARAALDAVTAAAQTGGGATASSPIASLAPRVLAGSPGDAAAAVRQVALNPSVFSGLPGPQSAASSATAPATASFAAPSFASRYASGGNYNTTQATNDFSAGKISQTQLDQVRNAAAGSLTTQPGLTPAAEASLNGRMTPLQQQQLSQEAQTAANAAAEQAHPSAPPGGFTPYGKTRQLGVPIDQQPAAVRSASGTTLLANGGSATIGGGPAPRLIGQPALTGPAGDGSPTASSGIFEDGQSVTHGAVNPSTGRPSLVATQPNSASAPGSAPMSAEDQQKAAVKAYPALGVAGSPENKAFIDSFTSGGRIGANILAIADSMFGPKSQPQTTTDTPDAIQVANGQTRGIEPLAPARIPAPALSQTPTGSGDSFKPVSGIPLNLGAPNKPTTPAPVFASDGSAASLTNGAGFQGLDDAARRAQTGIQNLGSTVAASDIQRSTGPSLGAKLANVVTSTFGSTPPPSYAAQQTAPGTTPGGAPNVFAGLRPPTPTATSAANGTSPALNPGGNAPAQPAAPAPGVSPAAPATPAVAANGANPPALPTPGLAPVAAAKPPTLPTPTPNPFGGLPPKPVTSSNAGSAPSSIPAFANSDSDDPRNAVADANGAPDAPHQPAPDAPIADANGSNPQASKPTFVINGYRDPNSDSTGGLHSSGLSSTSINSTTPGGTSSAPQTSSVFAGLPGPEGQQPAGPGPIRGYQDPNNDAGGGLHSSGLSSSGLDPFRNLGGGPDASGALNNATSASQSLNKPTGASTALASAPSASQALNRPTNASVALGTSTGSTPGVQSAADLRTFAIPAAALPQEHVDALTQGPGASHDLMLVPKAAPLPKLPTS